MEITVNGDAVTLDGPLTIARLLVEQKVKMPDMVSVEHNGKILDRAEFETQQVQSGDTVEFLYFMGGGA